MISSESKRRVILVLVGLGCVLLCGLICVVVSSPPAPPPKDLWPSWSPDSQRLVYECYISGPTEGGPTLWNVDEEEYLRQPYYLAEAADLCISDVGGLEQMRFEDQGGDWLPAWSPEGTWIAYLRQDGIYLVTPEGEHRRQLLSVNASTQLALEEVQLQWSPDGRRLLFSGCLDKEDADIYVVEVDTGTVHNMTSQSEWLDLAPRWVLDGERIVFYSADESMFHCKRGYDGADYQLKSMSADGNDERVLASGSEYRWLSVSNSGLISFVQGSKLQVTDLTGKPAELLVDDLGWSGWHAWSPDKRYLAYFYTHLTVLNVITGEEIESAQPVLGEDLTWSPDSQRVAVTVSNNRVDEHIYIFDLASATLRPLAYGDVDKINASL